jgi:hypothetical protein
MESLEPAQRLGVVEGAIGSRSRELSGGRAPVRVRLVDDPPKLLRELGVLAHQVSGTLLLGSELSSRLLQLREKTDNQARRWSGIPAGAQSSSAPPDGRSAALASIVEIERSGGSG